MAPSGKRETPHIIALRTCVFTYTYLYMCVYINPCVVGVRRTSQTLRETSLSVFLVEYVYWTATVLSGVGGGKVVHPFIEKMLHALGETSLGGVLVEYAYSTSVHGLLDRYRAFPALGGSGPSFY